MFLFIVRVFVHAHVASENNLWRLNLSFYLSIASWFV